MSLLCGLGYHTAPGVPRWNDGYYFARCTRCGVDLIRTPFSGWRVPNGYRVVWQEQPPASRPDVRLEPELELEPTEPKAAPVAEVRAPSAMEAPVVSEVTKPAVAVPDAKPATVDDKRRRLPVEALLERLRGTPGPGAAPPEPSAPAATSRRSDWDFMMEPEERARSVNHERETTSKSLPDTSEAPGTAIPVQPKPARVSPSIASRALVILRRRVVSTFRRARHNKQLAQAAFATLIFTVIVAGVLSLPKRPRSESQGPNPQQVMPVVRAEELETVVAATERSFVAARALSCRDAPALQARRVRVLARGASVQVLARDGEWVSLATSIGQCWASAKYVSAPRPL